MPSVCVAICGMLMLGGLLVSCPGPGGAQVSDLPPAELLKRHVVAIYDEDGNLLGSGASVSATGLILTAKHILEQRLQGQRAASYRMSVKIQTQRGSARRDAQLVATHPHMDIAILNAPEGDLIPPLLVGSPTASGDESWFAIGHPRGSGPGNQRLFATESGEWSSVQFSGGWFVLPTGFDTGMSGGPLILGDRIVGVVSYALNVTYVAPVAESLEFFDLLGFPTSESGVMRQEDHVGELAGKVQKYEQILSDIQIDRRWTCLIDAAWTDGMDRMPTAFLLKVLNERRLRSQPDMNARVRMDMVAEISTPGNPVMHVSGDDVEWVSGESNTAEFKNVLSNLQYEISSKALDYNAAAIGKMDFRIHVSRISGAGFIKDDPSDYAVCCSVLAPSGAVNRSLQLSVEATTCDPTIFSEDEGQSDDPPD